MNKVSPNGKKVLIHSYPPESESQCLQFLVDHTRPVEFLPLLTTFFKEKIPIFVALSLKYSLKIFEGLKSYFNYKTIECVFNARPYIHPLEINDSPFWKCVFVCCAPYSLSTSSHDCLF